MLLFVGGGGFLGCSKAFFPEDVWFMRVFLKATVKGFQCHRSLVLFRGNFFFSYSLYSSMFLGFSFNETKAVIPINAFWLGFLCARTNTSLRGLWPPL